MSDDWNGEHLIRNKKTTYAQRQRAIQSIVHEKRRQKGTNASKDPTSWGPLIHAAAVHARITKGKQ